MAQISRRGSGRRRSMSEINVVPYIDVMLVLVVILMVASPFVNPSLVNLPSIGKSSKAPDHPLRIVVKADGKLQLRDGSKVLASDLPATVAIIKQRQAANRTAPVPIVIDADKDLRYEQVMKVMDALQKENVARVGLAVQQESR